MPRGELTFLSKMQENNKGQGSPQEPEQKNPPAEKLEFLKREEVRTMAKDVAALREQESHKEREKIAKLQTGKEAGTEGKLQDQEQKHKEEKTQEEQKIKSSLMPKKAPTNFEKVFVRVVVGGIILFVIFNAVAFGFWYFTKDVKEESRQEEVSPESSPPTPEPTPQPEPAPLQPEPVPPQVKTPLFTTTEAKTIQISDAQAVLAQLSNVLLQELSPGFTEILVEQSLDAAPLSRQTILESLGITVPIELQEKFADRYTLLSYVAGTKKRLGLVVELKTPEGATEVLSAWEPTMEQDTLSFFTIIGGKGSAYTPFFRSATHQGVPVRFQTFSVIDFGIVYGIANNSLILTSSFESFQRIVDGLKAQTL